MDRISQALGRFETDIVDLDEDLIAARTTDFRRQVRGTVRALLRPRTTLQVQHVVRSCANLGVPLVPQGGNTSYCGAAAPSADGDQLLLSLERMAAVRNFDRLNRSMTVEAGAILADVRAEADPGTTSSSHCR